MWPFSESMRVFYDTCESILRLMQKYPDFYFCQSSAQYYKWLEEQHPETFEKVRRRVKEGRWEIVGGMWIEPDGNLPSGESFVRQLLYGKKYFNEKFGVEVKIGFMADSFGYACTLPQIMKGAGIELFLTQKLSWNDTTVFPYYFFRWIAPDGSSVLAHQTVGTYSEDVGQSEILKQIELLKSRQKLDDLLVLFGTGDHGGGVTEDMIKRALTFVEGKKHFKAIFSTADTYLRMIAKKIKKPPEVKDELYLQFHRGTYTNQSKVKRNNRKAECLLETAEKLATLASKYGYEYPEKALKEVWETLLLNQFHDVLPGSAIPEVYRDSEQLFESIFSKSDSIVQESMKAIAAKVDTAEQGRSILVFNSLSWPRTDVVEVPATQLGNVFEIYDDKERIVPSQILDEHDTVLFIAEDVPSVGYKEYKARRTGHVRQKLSTSLSAEEYDKEIKLENEFLIIKVDKRTGLVNSILNKKNGKETLREQGNKIHVFEDEPVRGRTAVNSPIDAQIFDAWEIYIYQQKGGIHCIELKEPLEVKLVEEGPVRARVTVKYKYAQEGRPDSVFTQDIMLHKGIPSVQFKLNVDWHAAHRLAKVAFPVAIHSHFTTYEAPYGHITRRDPSSPEATPEEKAKYEVPAQKWIDHSSEDGSFGVSLLNDCKYGFDVANDTLRMTLLRSAKSPAELGRIFGLPVDSKDASEISDQGPHYVAYALYPHRSDFKGALTTKKAYEFNYPLISHVEPNHKGVLPKSYSFVSVHPDNIIVTVIKRAEDSDSTILRFYETSGKDTEATLQTADALSEATETDLLEKQGPNLATEEGTVKLPVSKHEIKTMKLVSKKQQKASDS